MFRNRELKLPPQGIWPLDPGPPCRSEAGQWGPWGLRATGDPGPAAGAPAEAPGPATVDHGERGGGGRPVPCRGQHPADSPENVSSLVLAPRRRRGRAMQGRCARSTLSQLDLGFGFCTSCSRHGESRSQAPPHPVRPFLCRRTQGTQDPLAMGRQVGHDRSVRREGRHRPQRGDPGPFSAPELTSGTGTLRPGDALFLGLPPRGRPGGPLVWGRLLGVFTSGSTFCRCRRWPRPEGHAESTCGGPPVRAPSYLRTRPQGKALPT